MARWFSGSYQAQVGLISRWMQDMSSASPRCSCQRRAGVTSKQPTFTTTAPMFSNGADSRPQQVFVTTLHA